MTLLDNVVGPYSKCGIYIEIPEAHDPPYMLFIAMIGIPEDFEVVYKTTIGVN